MARPARVAARGFALGLAVGVAVVVAVVLTGGTVKDGSDLSFSLGGVVFGFGLVVWSTAILGGASLLAVKRHLRPDADWTLTDMQVAMGTLAAIGGGWMIGAVAATLALWSL